MLEDYVVIDLEMTGLNAKTDAILEVGAVRVRDGRQTETYGAIFKVRAGIVRACGRTDGHHVGDGGRRQGTGRGDAGIFYIPGGRCAGRARM